MRRLAALLLSTSSLACASAPPCPCEETTPPPAVDPPKPEAPPSKCTAEEHRQFDFWAGEWEVTIADGRVAGHNRIERAHGGCALVEHWASVTGGSGTSTNYFDPGKRLWVQNWVDANGNVIQLEGGLRDGAMHLEGRYVTPDGAVSKMRGIWTPLEDGRA